MKFAEFAAKYCERQESTPERLKEALLQQKDLYHPDGWMMLECQVLDSSRLGSLAVLPYGPNNTFKSVPDYPVSPRGLASDMSVVVAVLTTQELQEA